DCDGHLCGEEERAALERERAGVGQPIGDRAQRGLRLPLGEPEECEPRLGIVAELDGLSECTLGALEVASAPPNLTEFAVCPRSVARIGGHELVDSCERVTLGIVERAADAQHLSAMESAQAGKVTHGLAFTPSQRAVGPLARAAPVANVAARPNRAAIHHPRSPKRCGSAHRQRVRLVDEPESARYIALDDANVTEALACERLEF